MLKDCMMLTDISETVFYINTSKVNYIKITEEEFIRVGTGGEKEKARGLHFQFEHIQEKVVVVITEEDYKGITNQIKEIIKGK